VTPAELAERPFYPALYPAYVTENADPLGLYRCKLQIPGLVEPSTDWAPPIGAIGGGGPQRGGWVVPATGATVGVLFLGGDPERPFYLGGWWGVRSDTGSEMPEPAKDAGPNAHQVASLQIGGFTFSVDERPTGLNFVVKGQANSLTMSLELDLANMGIILNAPTAIVLQTSGRIVLDALGVTLKGRHVLTSGKPI
jgi:hypothetical protein